MLSSNTFDHSAVHYTSDSTQYCNSSHIIASCSILIIILSYTILHQHQLLLTKTPFSSSSMLILSNSPVRLPAPATHPRTSRMLVTQCLYYIVTYSLSFVPSHHTLTPLFPSSPPCTHLPLTLLPLHSNTS